MCRLVARADGWFRSFSPCRGNDNETTPLSLLGVVIAACLICICQHELPGSCARRGVTAAVKRCQYSAQKRRSRTSLLRIDASTHHRRLGVRFQASQLTAPGRSGAFAGGTAAAASQLAPAGRTRPVSDTRQHGSLRPLMAVTPPVADKGLPQGRIPLQIRRRMPIT